MRLGKESWYDDSIGAIQDLWIKADKEIEGYDYRVVVVVVSGGGRRPWWWYEVNECEEGRKDMKMNLWLHLMHYPYLNVNSTDRFATAMCVEWHCRKLCG